MEPLIGWVDKGARLAELLDAAGVEIVRRDGVLYSNSPVLAHQIAATVDAVAEAKAEAKAAVAERRWREETRGITVGPYVIATDRTSQQMMTGKAVALQVFPALTIKWKTLEGFADITAETFFQIAGAAAAHVQACFDREAALGTAIDAGEPYDIDAGWPE